MRTALLVTALLCAAACGPTEEAPQTFIAEASDFDCVLPNVNDALPYETRWHKVRNFFLRRPNGPVDEALAVANGEAEGPYPVGTMLQLVYFEAMAKRGGDFSPESEGWEFFALDVTSDGSTTIESRGGKDVVNFAGGNCFDCHALAEPKYDFVCETGHGCADLGVPQSFIESAQNDDPRCK